MKKLIRSTEKIFLLAVAFVAVAGCQSAPASLSTPSHPLAEYDYASLILMHQPTAELFLGVAHPDAALFEAYFDADKAAAEHAGYQQLLRKSGANVVTVRDVLLRGTLDRAGNPIAGAALDSLRAFALDFLKYDASGLSVQNVDSAAVEQEKYRRKVIGQMAPTDLIRVILLQPEVHLQSTPENTGYAATYSEKPLMNLYFMRDQMITTAKGVVLGRMNSVQRNDEVRIADFCLHKMGIPPVGRIEGDGAYLEGGDFLSFGQNAFIGCGLRTTLPAIRQLMENNWLGCDTLIVVNDRWHDQSQMHLDTYFNVIDHDLATLSKKRYQAAKDSTSSHYLTVDVYVRHADGTYQRTIKQQNFVDYLKNHLKMTIIPISEADENTFACNYLTVGARHIMAVDGQSEDFQTALAKNRVKVTWVPLNNLTKGYGAAHCMTQVLSRKSSR